MTIYDFNPSLIALLQHYNPCGITASFHSPYIHIQKPAQYDATHVYAPTKPNNSMYHVLVTKCPVNTSRTPCSVPANTKPIQHGKCTAWRDTSIFADMYKHSYSYSYSYTLCTNHAVKFRLNVMLRAEPFSPRQDKTRQDQTKHKLTPT